MCLSVGCTVHTLMMYISFSRQNACNRTSCMCVALSSFFTGARKQNRDSLGFFDSILMASERPKIIRFWDFARSNVDRTIFPIFLNFIVVTAMLTVGLCSTTILWLLLLLDVPDILSVASLAIKSNSRLIMNGITTFCTRRENTWFTTINEDSLLLELTHSKLSLTIFARLSIWNSER